MNAMTTPEFELYRSQFLQLSIEELEVQMERLAIAKQSTVQEISSMSSHFRRTGTNNQSYLPLRQRASQIGEQFEAGLSVLREFKDQERAAHDRETRELYSSLPLAKLRRKLRSLHYKIEALDKELEIASQRYPENRIFRSELSLLQRKRTRLAQELYILRDTIHNHQANLLYPQAELEVSGEQSAYLADLSLLSQLNRVQAYQEILISVLRSVMNDLPDGKLDCYFHQACHAWSEKNPEESLTIEASSIREFLQGVMITLE